MEQLIQSCSAYLHCSKYPTPVSSFLTWVITTANEGRRISDKNIESQFLSARIWGNVHLLPDIRAQLLSILGEKKKLPPSSAHVNGYSIYLNNEIDKVESSYCELIINDGDDVITIYPDMDNDKLRKLSLEIIDKKTTINDATDVANLLNRTQLSDMNELLANIRETNKALELLRDSFN